MEMKLHYFYFLFGIRMREEQMATVHCIVLKNSPPTLREYCRVGEQSSITLHKLKYSSSAKRKNNPKIVADHLSSMSTMETAHP